MKIVRNIAVALAALIVVLVIAAIFIVRSSWFRNYVKQTIIANVDSSTGGRAQIGTLNLSLTSLSAALTDFVIRGKEPPNSPPLLQIGRIQADFRLFPSLHQLWSITYLGIDQPQANVMVFSNGETNIPSPLQESKSTNPLQTVVNLAIGRFEVANGLIDIADQKQTLNVRGNNLRAQLFYNPPNQQYRGQFSLEPVYVVAGRNTPVNLTVNVPLVLSRNRIDVNNANIFSAASAITISASLQDLKNPEISARAAGHIALTDLKNIASVPLSLNGRNIPTVVDVSANLSETNHEFNISGLQLALGQSNLAASGSVSQGVTFNSRLALGQLGRLLNEPSLPNDVATLSGKAALAQDNLTITALRASALAGEFTGEASLHDFSTYLVRGDLMHFDLASVIRAAGQARLPYDGILSGPVRIVGNLKTRMHDLMAEANLSIAPGSRGIPVSGSLNADYGGARDDLSIRNSHLDLPHSRLSINGSVGKQLNVALTTTDLNDLWAAVPQSSRPPVALDGGEASFTGQVTGRLSAPRISGDFTANHFSVEGRQFNSLNVDAFLDKNDVSIQRGSLGRDMMQATFSGNLGLRDWKPIPSSPIAMNVSVQNGELPDLLALAGEQTSGYSGQLNGNARVTGTFGNPRGAASFVVTNGTIQGQPFDRAEAQVNLTDQLIAVPTAFVQLGPARVNFTAQFQHPRNSFTRGQLRAYVQSNQINLAQVNQLQKQRPNTAGSIQVQANVAGNVSNGFDLSSVNGDLSVRGLRSEGQAYGDLMATAATVEQTVNYNLTSDFAGSNIVISGHTKLAPGYPTTARANLANLPIQRVLAVANRSSIPVKGLLSGTATFDGTAANPQGSADFTLVNGSIYDDSVNRLQAHVIYQPRSINISQLELVSGPSRLALSARYDHPAGDLRSGSVRFEANSNRIELARIKTLAEQRPGLAGSLRLDLSGAAQIRPNGAPPLIQDLNGNLDASDLAVSGKKLGDLNLAAKTAGGRLNIALDSNLAGASIEGRGNLQLANDYLSTAQLKFNNVTWAGLRPLVAPSFADSLEFEAMADGQVSVNGPLTNVQQLNGSVQVTRLDISGVPSLFSKTSHVLLQNQGPISATLDRGRLKIQNARLTGPQTNFQAAGTIPLNGHDVDVSLNGNVNLAIFERFDQSITSSGNIVVAAGVRGSLATPRLTGQIELQNASFDTTSLPTGVWRANGIIALNGNGAVIRNFTAQSGGGQVTVTGSATFSTALRFAFQAKASRVRVLVQQGVGVVASADLSLFGTPENSVLSGAITLDDVTYTARSDLGSLLSLAAPPVQAPSLPSSGLEHMRLDIRIRSSSALGLQASLARNLQLSADLRVRGTAANPGMLGRVIITEGKLVFFGSTYTVNVGTISFYNPVRIQPVLNLSLETTAQGVDVVLKVTGPLDDMKLSYTSDPPLPFQEIVSLLTTGTAPITDPTLLANQPALPPQTFQQLGESAIVGQAVANPVANQLQRVFGITELRINPAFTSGTQLPETQVTLQQQISSNVTFTYVTWLNTANAETIQVQWTFTPRWSAQALRDYNGIFSVTLLYKRQLR